MNKFRINAVHCIIALFAAVFLCGGILLFSACSSSTVSTGGDREFRFDNYDVTYDISSNCSIKVTEILDVHYISPNSTGFYRDIPANSGAQVKNIKVTGVELLYGATTVPYDVIIEDNDFITVDIGSAVRKGGKNEVYLLTYDYYISNSVINKGLLPLVPIGTGWDCEIYNASATLLIPDGLKSIKVYVGKAGIKEHEEIDPATLSTDENGKKVLTVSADRILNKYEGITVDLQFEKGAIKPYFEFTPYWFVIIAAVILAVLIVVKVLCFNKITLTPVVNFEAPDNMDPLLMGKLIDNKVDPEDVTALIFYWADKGYLKINLDNKDNPTLIRIRNLPDTAASYEKIVFAGLFQKDDMVTTKSLTNKFYRTFEKAKANVNARTKGLYSKQSVGISIIFALLGTLLIGLAPFILGLAQVSSTLLYFFGFVALIPTAVIYVLTTTTMYNMLKLKGKKKALFIALLALVVVLCTGILTLIIPSSLLPLAPKILLCLLGFSTVAASVLIVNRTPEYNEQLNHIVGFRNFIKFSEKERLEALLESDPEYYYHVLPYAQVLNVSDIWEEKFKNITVAPPAWATASTHSNIVDFIILNSLIRHSMISLSTGIKSRPSSSGRNGYHGHFGGRSGGGFGGGGGRGR